VTPSSKKNSRVREFTLRSTLARRWVHFEHGAEAIPWRSAEMGLHSALSLR